MARTTRVFGPALRHLLLLSCLVVCGLCQCHRADWSSSFDKAGDSLCSHDHQYVSGLYRIARGSSHTINLLEGAECCDTPYSWASSSSLTLHSDWTRTLDNANTLATCPEGFFLYGLRRSDDPAGGSLHNIEGGRCTKPGDHPHHYEHCFLLDVDLCMNREGMCKCDSGYYVTGIYKSNCNDLSCLDSLRCCKMAAKPDVLVDMSSVKTRVMESTMRDLAYLAHYLGYGWCSGCRANLVGEDFLRDGDTWRADQRGGCSGYMSDQRLSIVYDNWAFEIKNISYGKAITEDVEPESLDSGVMYNKDDFPAKKTISRSLEVVRSVTHSTTSAWKHSHELGVEVTYSAGIAGGPSAGASYSFGYERSSSTTDTTNNQQSKKFQVDMSKTIGPNSAVGWTLNLFRTRTTIPYKATIAIKFSAELQGFLRWGGGHSGANTNFHYQYRGGGDRPTVNYRFGDEKTPFYTALRDQTRTNAKPWQWYDMKSYFPAAEGLIQSLMDDTRYTFELEGKFEDVQGTRVDVAWKGVNIN